MSTRIHIIQRTALHIAVTVQSQRIRDIAKVCIFRQEISRCRTVITCSQILHIHIRIVGFRILCIYIVVLRFAKRDVAISVITVRLPDHTLTVSYSGYASSRIVRIVSCPAIKTLVSKTLISIAVSCIHDTIDVQFHQYFRIFTVHIIHVLDQLVVLLLAGRLDQTDQLLFRFRYFSLNREQNAALVCASSGIRSVSVCVTVAIVSGIAIPVLDKRPDQSWSDKQLSELAPWSEDEI